VAQSVSYNAQTQSSAKLNWLPYQEEKPKADSAVRPVQYSTPMPNYSSTATRAVPTPAVRPSPGNTSPPSKMSDAASERRPALLPAPASEMENPLSVPPSEPASEPTADASSGNPSLEFPAESGPAVRPNTDRQFAVDTPAKTPAKTPPRAKSSPNEYSGTRDNSLPNGGGNSEGERYCHTIKEIVKPISALSAEVRIIQGQMPQDCPWGENERFAGRSWRPLTYTWTASALCHKPLYFEDVHLERYGHMLGPWVQPIVSHARFFATVPILPYEMGIELPNECMYTLGHYRPGSCAPYYLDPIPLSARAALFEGAVIAGGIAILP
jgi:hypothetical protein